MLQWIKDCLDTAVHYAYQKLNSPDLWTVKAQKSISLPGVLSWFSIVSNEAVAVEKTQSGDLKLVNSVLWHGS